MAQSFKPRKSEWPELWHCPKCRQLSLAYSEATKEYYCKDRACGYQVKD